MSSTPTPTTEQPSEVERLVAGYLTAWNTADVAVRRTLVERHWAPGCRYLNPLREYRDHDGMLRALADTFDRWGAAGHRFTAREPVDEHHGRILFRWSMADAEGAPVSIGTHVWTLDGSGRIADDVQFANR
jgi:hypothetical protein